MPPIVAVAPSVPTTGFVFVQIPMPLLHQIYDSPLAIGVYALIARRFAITNEPVPLSANDIQAFDPSLSYGAVVRALARLTNGSWLMASTRSGSKTHYTPTWGAIRGTPRLWHMQAPRLDRPPHIRTVRLPASLLDTYMGRITPHPLRPALIARYFSHPALKLSDTGVYALTLAGIRATTPQLERYGLLRNTQPCPVSDERTVLAQISQVALTDPHGPLITIQGMRRLGYQNDVSPSSDTDDTARTLFFVPKELIGTLIAPSISTSCGNLIGSASGQHDTASALVSTSRQCQLTPRVIPCSESKESHETILPPPHGGGGISDSKSVQNQPEPLSEAEQLLRSAGIRPHVAHELRNLPLDQIQAAIADSQGRSNVRDAAAWTVSLLRMFRDHGWKPHPIARTDDLAASFARLQQAHEQTIERLWGQSDEVFVTDDQRLLPHGPGQLSVIDSPPVAAPLMLEARDHTEPERIMTTSELTTYICQEARLRLGRRYDRDFAQIHCVQDGVTLRVFCATVATYRLLSTTLRPALAQIAHDVLGLMRVDVQIESCQAYQASA